MEQSDYRNPLTEFDVLPLGLLQDKARAFGAPCLSSDGHGSGRTYPCARKLSQGVSQRLIFILKFRTSHFAFTWVRRSAVAQNSEIKRTYCRHP